MNLSRNKREGIYAGWVAGVHRRTKAITYKLFPSIPIPSWLWAQRKIHKQNKMDTPRFDDFKEN